MAERRVRITYADGTSEIVSESEAMAKQQPEQSGMLQGIKDWAAKGARGMGGELASMASSLSPVGDYTLDVAGALLPFVSGADIRNLANEYRQEKPLQAGAYDVLGAFSPTGIYKAAGEVGELALKSPRLTNLAEAFIQGSAKPYAQEGEEQPDATDRALAGTTQAGLTAALSGVVPAITKGAQKLGLDEATTGLAEKLRQALGGRVLAGPEELSPGAEQLGRLLENPEVAGMTPELLQAALQREARAVAQGQGGIATAAEMMGEAPQGIAETLGQTIGGRSVAQEALGERLSPDVLRGQMEQIAQPLGAKEPFLASQQATQEALLATEKAGRKEASKQGRQIYKGMLPPQKTETWVNEYGQERKPPKQLGLPNTTRIQLLPAEVKYSDEMERIAKDPTYQAFTKRVVATTYPKGESAPDIRDPRIAKQVAGELERAISNPAKYRAETDIVMAKIPAQKLLKTINDELNRLDVTIPQRDMAYKGMLTKARGLDENGLKVMRGIMSGGAVKKPGEQLFSDSLDIDTFKSITKAVEEKTGLEGVDKIKRGIAGAIREGYATKEGKQLIDAPFKKGDLRFNKIATLIGEEPAAQMLEKTQRLGQFLKFNQRVLEGPATARRKIVKDQFEGLREKDIAENIDAFLTYAGKGKGGFIRSFTTKFFGGGTPLPEKEMAQFMFNKGDAATQQIKALIRFYNRAARDKAAKQELIKTLNGYSSLQIQQALVNAGLSTSAQ